MELEVKESKKLDDGLHKGTINRIEYRTEPYSYTDVFIEVNGYEAKAGYPTVISENSKLGKLLMRFGVELKVGEKLDPNEVLIGKVCQFQTSTETGKDGNEYSRVLVETVKPL